MKTILITLTILLATTINCFAGVTNFEHEIKVRDDGGFTIIITGTIRHLKPITAEGFFPKENVHYQIELKGNGQDWSYRNQSGSYYSYPENVVPEKQYWDVGYAWVDKNKEYIYLNFYWVKAPDSLEESSVNGKYKIKNKP